MLVTLCDIQCGWISCSRVSARCWWGQFPLLGQAFPRTIRDKPQVQSRQKMKCSTVPTAVGTRLWGTWLVCDQFTYSKHHGLSEHSSKKRLPLFEMSKGLWFISLFPPPEQNRGFPWGHWDLFYSTWIIQKAQIFSNAFVALAYCSQHAGIQYFYYGLWYYLWYTGRGQHRSPRTLFMAWNFDINYHIFKRLIPNNIFVHNSRKLNNLLL